MAKKVSAENAKEKAANGQNHTVNLSLRATDIAKAGAAVTFKVKNRVGLLGTIEIGQGTFGWKGHKKQTFKRIPWTAFADLLNGRG